MDIQKLLNCASAATSNIRETYIQIYIVGVAFQKGTTQLIKPEWLVRNLSYALWQMKNYLKLFDISNSFYYNCMK